MKSLLDWLGAVILLALVRVRISMSDRGAERLAVAAAWGMRVLIPSRRRIADRNIRRAFPAMTGQKRADLIRLSYRAAAINFSDLLIPFRNGRDAVLSRTRITGAHHLKAALAAGKGVVGVSAHYGVFPLMGAMVPSLGVPFRMLYRRPKSPKTAGLFDDWINLAGCEIITDSPRHLAGIKCLQALAEGACVCILADQHYAAGVSVPFFGHPSLTGIGPALLAARSRAPLVPMVIRREPDGTHLLTIEPPLPPPADRSREALTACIAELTGRIEGWIRDEPSQWFWVHRRWKDLDRMEDAAKKA